MHMMKTTIAIAALAVCAAVNVSLASEGKKRPIQWTPSVGEYGTAQLKAWNYYCQTDPVDGGLRVRVIVDGYNVPDSTAPNTIKISMYPGGPIPGEERFIEEQVSPACAEYLGSPANITGWQRVIPDPRRK